LLAALIIWRAIMEFSVNSNDVPLTIHATDKNASLSTTGLTTQPMKMTGLVLTGLLLVIFMAVYQVCFTPSAVYRDGESKNNLPVIDYKSVPMVGSPDAPYVISLLFDYQCPHCQKLHFMLSEAVRRYNGKLAFALCPVPLSTECNPYIPYDVDAFKNSCELARLSLAVWVAKREAFPAFENWMFTFESGSSWLPRSPETARAKAIELVGEVNFDTARTNPWIGSYMQTCIGIYGQTLQSGKSGVPKLVRGSHWVIPEPYDADDLIEILQKSLAVPSP
jgi:protein-disulfide isomerase